MGSTDKTPDQINPISSNVDPWKERIIIPTLLAGIAGGAVGLISKHRKVIGLSQISATYAKNLAIVTGCYCGAREFTRVNRIGKPDDLLNSLIGGIGSGAILGRLHGGPVAAVRYSIMFAVVGTLADYAILNLKPEISKLTERKESWFEMPEWSPIRVLDEEALTAKRAREEQIFRSVHNLKKEES
ncbi:hypothetical protein ACJIZ3_017720 [Penstemon smallii]|uniref:Uncharacterized protein n=1 Tax=Penstemon smallii TaxID=265156 RepID=A0ABD3SXL1_9LAMI